MQQSITITLPTDVRRELDDFVLQAGRSQDEVVGEAVREHLLLQRTRSLKVGSASDADLDAVYREMAADEACDDEAYEWAEATSGDA